VAEKSPRSGAELIAAQAWLERVQRSEEQAALELDRSDAELAQRREALTTAGQRRQALERLKDRQREAHRVKSARREAGILDEIALTGHVRRAS
jgi:flagellar export protein FliJ